MSELRQPIKPEDGSLIMYMMAQTTKGRCSLLTKNVEKLSFYSRGVPCLWKGQTAGKDQL